MAPARQSVPKDDLQSQALQILDRIRALMPGDDACAVPYNCDPHANHRAIVSVNELCRLGLLTSTRQEAIEAIWRELDKATEQAET